MHSEFLLETTGSAVLQLQLRFLHLFNRQVAKFSNGRFEPVPSLDVEGQLIESWDEGVERSVDLELTLAFRSATVSVPFFRQQRDPTAARRPPAVSRNCPPHPARNIRNRLGFLREYSPGLLKLTVEITNTTPFEHDPGDRNLALLRSLLSAHTILSVSGGQFVSLLDPPEELRDAASACTNLGNFPVLAGDPPQRDLLLCSPIVLYDYPQIAPESATDFYDATEMDEMLTLRVMTLTDDEKNEMRLADDHVRNLLERTEQSAREQLMKTHGTIRGLRPVSGDKP